MSLEQPKQQLSNSQFIQTAVSYHQRGDLHQAELMYCQLLEVHPGSPDVLHLLGVVKSQLGHYEEAVDLIHQAIDIQPNIPEYYNDLALVHTNHGYFEKAVNSCKQSIKINPESGIAYFNLGNSYFQLGQYEAAVTAYTKAVALNSDNVNAIYNLGNALRELNKFEEAAVAFEKSLRLKTDFAEAHNNLGDVLRKLGKSEPAEIYFKQAIIHSPDYVDAYANLGITLVELGKLEDAKAMLEKALLLNPDHAEAHNFWGIYYQKVNLYDKAIKSYEKAIELNPDYAEAYNRLGGILMLQHQLEAAQFYVEKALKLDPDLAAAYCNLGNIYLINGHIRRAQDVYKKALSLDPFLTDARKNLAHIQKNTTNDQNEINRILSQLSDPQLDEGRAVVLHFALGKIFDDGEEYDRAFFHYHKANTLKRKTVEFNPELHKQIVDQIIHVFSRTYFKDCALVGDTSNRPVFIIGMPRSGTTLVEQIIASHPLAFGADELEYFNLISQSLTKILKTDTNYPFCVEQLDQVAAQSIIQDYLDLLSSYSSKAERITDKMPLNFMHLGLIAILFPNAKIIHCRRNELDTCLSIYFQLFTFYHPYSYNLDEIGAYYYQYKRLMNHWREVLPGKFYEVDYEELLNDQEKESQRLIEYIGLPWDKQCLSFHKTKRPVMTASNWQVRQPIYTSSLNRWKNYESYLESLKEKLKTG